MNLKSFFGLSAAAFGVALAFASPASAAALLPAPNCGTVPGTNCLQFQDFTVYSLALLNFQAGAGPIGPSDPYAVSTNGTALQNALVVGTGVAGAGSLNSDLGLTGVDDAYRTPSAQGGGITNFVPNAGNQGAQGVIPGGNSSGTWDITVSALNQYLNGGSLNFFFNLNQTNSKTTTYLNSPEDALGWMQVTLKDSTGQHSAVSFWLDGNACNGQLGVPGSGNCDPSQSVSQSIDPNAAILPADPLHDEWAYIHGQICVSPAGAVVNFGACAKNDHTNSTVNQNLGANDASFGLYSDALQTALNSGLYDVLSIDFRMAALTNGYEQLLIFAGNRVPQDVPEPLTITLFGAGLAGLGVWRRRRKA